MQNTNKKLSATNFLSELTKLKTQQKYLEATQIVLKPQNCSPTESTELNELEHQKLEQEMSWASFAQKVKSDTLHIRDLLREFRIEMMNKDGLCKFSTKQYRERIQLIDQQLRDAETKNIELLRQLKLEYCSIESELLPVMSKLDLLQTPQTPSAIGRKASAYATKMNVRRAVSAPIEKSDSDDVKKFDKYLRENCGHTGGWIDEEHVLFLKLKNKYRTNIEQICNAFKLFYVGNIWMWNETLLPTTLKQIYLPLPLWSDKSENDIRAHNDWYEKYLELKMKKRLAIENWKRNQRQKLHSAWAQQFIDWFKLAATATIQAYYCTVISA